MLSQHVSLKTRWNITDACPATAMWNRSCNIDLNTNITIKNPCYIDNWNTKTRLPAEKMLRLQNICKRDDAQETLPEIKNNRSFSSAGKFKFGILMHAYAPFHGEILPQYARKKHPVANIWCNYYYNTCHNNISPANFYVRTCDPRNARILIWSIGRQKMAAFSLRQRFSSRNSALTTCSNLTIASKH